MRKVTAERISKYFQKRAAEKGHPFVIQRLPANGALEGFHHWADGDPLISADEIRRDDGMVIYCLLIDWQQSDEWYLVLCAQKTHAPLVEIRNEIQEGKIVRLEWNYKPTKHDGRNSERVAFFNNHVGDTTVQIQVPAADDRSLRFIEELFDLVANRIEADKLSPGRT